MWFSTHRHHVGRSPLCRIHCSWNHQSLHRQPPLLPASLSALYCHITSIFFFFRFHLLLDLLQWVGGRYGGMPSGEKRQVAFREKNYMQLKESRVYTPDCSSWWSEQKTKRGEPSCCSPAALLILLSSQHLTNEAWFWTYSIIKQEQHFRSNLFRIKATLSPEYVFNMYIFDLWGSEI